ncbi:hypothetical protein SERLADRAFT_345304, partial [Serpula lacrymans var. lacrymans S7.9]
FPLYIINNPKFCRFAGAIEAINGMHIACIPSAAERDASQNCKGGLSQHCLACYNFDLRFTHILSGWEESVADAV